MRLFLGNRGEAFKQGATGVVLLSGCGLSFISAILMVVFAMGGVFRGTYTRDVLHGDKITDAGTLNWVPLVFLFFTLGIVMILGAVIYGLYASATERSGPRVARPAKVLARYAFNREGNMLVADWEIEGADNPRYYLRLDFGGELGALECECSETVFKHCGEGMTGMVELQGKWVGSFAAYVGAAFQSEHIADDSQVQVNREGKSDHWR